MLTEYISQKLNKAKYRIIDDGSYFGEIPGLKGVWANEKNLENCRETLREVLEEWLILKLKDGDKITGLGDIELKDEQSLIRESYHQYA